MLQSLTKITNPSDSGEKKGEQKMKTLYSDNYTIVEVGTKYGYVTRIYNDADDVVTRVPAKTAYTIVDDMIEADNDGTSMPSHYISRHIADIYPTI